MMIINADDFGLSESASTAIAEAFKLGLISDTTMLANGVYFEESVKLANEKGFIKNVGIHFNLTEGVPLTSDIKNCPAFCENGVFHKRINRLKPLSSYEKTAVYKELFAQAKRIKEAGFEIDHADSHHHIHTAIFIAPIVFKICREFKIDKIRLHRNIGNISSYKKLIKNLYNKSLTKKGFNTTDYFGSLEDIKSDNLQGNLEIMVHPDFDKDGVLIDRRDFVDGIPVGVPLNIISSIKKQELSTYGDL